MTRTFLHSFEQPAPVRLAARELMIGLFGELPDE